MRIGLFGGTFNPIHNGHLHIAKEIGAGFPLDRIYLIPCANPPHKTSRGLAAAHDRLEMIRQALAGCIWLKVSDVELLRSGPSYTIDTIKYFRSQCLVGDKLYMLVGLDAFLELDTWKEYLKIVRLISLIVMPRPMSTSKVSTDQNARVADFIHTKLSENFFFDPVDNAYLHPDFQPIYTMLRLHPLDISSTNVRRHVDNGEVIASMVPEKVAHYINAKGLYR